MNRAQFGRAEKLKSRKAIAALFARGESLKSYPVALRFLAEAHDLKTARSAFSVAKKRHPRAVDRNRIKRQMREAYRLAKAQGECQNWAGYDFMWIYLPAEPCDWPQMQKAMSKALARLPKALSRHLAEEEQSEEK